MPKRLIYCFDGGHRMTGLKDFGAEHVLGSRGGSLAELRHHNNTGFFSKFLQHNLTQHMKTCQRTRVLPGMLPNLLKEKKEPWPSHRFKKGKCLSSSASRMITAALMSPNDQVCTSENYNDHSSNTDSFQLCLLRAIYMNFPCGHHQATNNHMKWRDSFGTSIAHVTI